MAQPIDICTQVKPKCLVSTGSKMVKVDRGKIWDYARLGDLGSIEQLVTKYNMNPYSIDKEGWDPMHYACLKGKEDVVAYLIHQDRDPVGRSTKRGRTHVHHAAIRGNINILQMLLPIVINHPGQQNLINQRDNKGATALHYACDRGDLKSARILLRYGSDPNIFDNHNKWSPMFYATVRENIELCELLRTFGGRINVHDAKGDTPLHYAVTQRNKNLVKYFVATGAKIHAENNEEVSPLSFAAKEIAVPMVRLAEEYSNYLTKSITEEESRMASPDFARSPSPLQQPPWKK